jgi:Ca-activated chloride channel family protein
VLSDFRFSRPDGEEVRAEIVRLGLTYDLLTRYTSFVAVHDVVRNAGGSGEQVEQPLPLPLGVSEMAVGREPELLVLSLLAAAGLGLASLLPGIAR